MSLSPDNPLFLDIQELTEKSFKEQFNLAVSRDRTQKLRARKTGDFQLLSLDIVCGKYSLPGLTVAVKDGNLQISFVEITQGKQITTTYSYVGQEKAQISSHGSCYGLEDKNSFTLIEHGAFNQDEAKIKCPEVIDIEQSTQNIVARFKAMSETPKGFEPVKVAALLADSLVPAN